MVAFCDRDTKGYGDLVSNQTVDVFYFEDAVMAARAEKEAETVRYIRSKTNFTRVDAVYGIYAKLIENNVFSTEVGYAFLAELYRILQENGAYNESDLPKVYISKGRMSGAAEQEHSQKTDGMSSEGRMAKQGQSNEEALSDEDEARVIEAVRKRTKTLNDTSKTQVRNIREMYRDKLKTYKMVIAALALCIVGMLAMLYFSDASPLRDAEQQVLDKYAAWQETLQQQEESLQKKQYDLTEREAALAAWEKELEEKQSQLSGQ